MQPEIRENTFDAGIVTINYAEISSSSTPLILLHGGSNRWQRFWETYFRHYAELHPFKMEDLIQWGIVTATASRVWGPPVMSNDQRISFINAALSNAEHPWISD